MTTSTVSTSAKRKGFRRVHISGTTWYYKIGRQSVTIFFPTGKKCVAQAYSVAGITFRDNNMITPADVVRYIWAKLWIQENERQAIREPGVIASVIFGKDPNHRVLTSFLTIAFAGSVQAFGGGSFKTEEDMQDYLQKLCKTFGVDQPASLKGLRCFALRSLPSESQDIVGLEAADTGERFLHHKWYRERYNTKLHPLDAKKNVLNMMIQSATREIESAKACLATIDQEYVDWEKKT